MPFSIIDRNAPWGRPTATQVISARLVYPETTPLVEIAISGDLARAIGVFGGGRVLLMLGEGEDAGSFALERAQEHDSRARRISQRPGSSMHQLRVSARMFPIGNLENTRHFTPDLVGGGRLIARRKERNGFHLVAAE